MSGHMKENVESVKHPTQEGVFMRHFFTKDETSGRFNNLEVSILPGFHIAPHTHEDAGEFFYVVSGSGEFLDGTEWIPVKRGDAFEAPKGMIHAVKNAGAEPLILLSTFSPPMR